MQTESRAEIEARYQAREAWAQEQAEHAQAELAKPLLDTQAKLALASILAWACYQAWLLAQVL